MNACEVARILKNTCACFLLEKTVLPTSGLNIQNSIVTSIEESVCVLSKSNETRCCRASQTSLIDEDAEEDLGSSTTMPRAPSEEDDKDVGMALLWCPRSVAKITEQSEGIGAQSGVTDGVDSDGSDEHLTASSHESILIFGGVGKGSVIAVSLDSFLIYTQIR